MHIFYAPNIISSLELPEGEAKHATQVLRLKEGDSITITDGLGFFYEATITTATKKKCRIQIDQTIEVKKPFSCSLHLAMAPTKQMERTEWWAEKATEIGIDEMSFLNAQFSERRAINLERIEKKIISATKQSLKAHLPIINDLTSFSNFIEQEFNGQKFIAHCYPTEKKLLKNVLRPNTDTLILIGPEGDFSESEVEMAIAKGFVSITLGEARLRTETAALVAVHTFTLINQ